MSAALLDDLLAGYTEPAAVTSATPTRAKAANSAKVEDGCGLAPYSTPCERLRIVANPAAIERVSGVDSQVFAAIRKPTNRPHSEQARGSSQESQDSQQYRTTCETAVPLEFTAAAGADKARFLDRRARLMRWGWAKADAEQLAERLANCDRDCDDRVSCTDCSHFQPGRCGTHKAARLQAPGLARDFAELLQRCPGFQPSR